MSKYKLDEDIYDCTYCAKDCCEKGDYETLTLNKDGERVLHELVRDWLHPRKTINHAVSSYHLKHVFEKIAPFYISNADMKKAMVSCGFKHDKMRINWHFNIDSISLDELEYYTEKKRGK